MLDLHRLNRIRLDGEPTAQKLLANTVLLPNYTLLPGVDITVEGLDRLPDEPVIYAMNHTDRYNYWPFQYHLYRQIRRFTATWVKGKYYENAFVGWFMEVMNNIPTVSRGYLISRDFAAVMGRAPRDAEYRALRAEVDQAAGVREVSEAELAGRDEVPATIYREARDVLGLPFDPDHHSYADYINALFQTMMRRFVELNDEAMREGLDLLIFPQGTRSIRLSRGRIGLAQIALHSRQTVVPVGCNGSDKVYPGSSPFAKAGRIVYRIGQPIRWEEMAEFHIAEDFEPFTPGAENAHRDQFQGYVDVIMERIDALLDPPYQFADDLQSDGVSGSGRFL